MKGIAALITTFGVGELSAINGVAGAFAENVPLVHIVGCPSTISQRSGMLLHHTLGNGDFNVFANMSSQISCELAKLNSPYEIAAQIDHTLRQCWVCSRPVYIMLPTDMVRKKIEGECLQTPIDLSMPRNEEDRENYVVETVLKYLHAAKNPVILVDACAIRHRVLPEVHDLIDKTNLRVFSTPMGKGAVNETHPNYAGVYAGDGSLPSVKEQVENSDLILSIGALKVRASSHACLYHRQLTRRIARATSTQLASPTEPLSSIPSTSTARAAQLDTPSTPAWPCRASSARSSTRWT